MDNVADVNVIIFASMQYMDKYIKINEYENIKIVSKTTTLIELKGAIVLYKNSVVVVDEDNAGVQLDDILSYLDGRVLGVVLSSTKLALDTTIKKYNNCHYVYKNNLISKSNDFINELVKKIYLAGNVNVSNNTIEKPNDDRRVDVNEAVSYSSDKELVSDDFSQYEKYKRYNKVIAIGASTGGTEMVFKILQELPETLNLPIFVVQHMPKMFTNLYATRMNKTCAIKVVEAKDGDPVYGRIAYIAPGGKQMVIEKRADGHFIKILPEDPNYFNNPSVDVMFDSVAANYGRNVVAVILTGMGKDGTNGLLNIKKHGGYTIGQDEKTSVVYGMPKVAYDSGAVIRQLPLDEIPGHIVAVLRKR